MYTGGVFCLAGLIFVFSKSLSVLFCLVLFFLCVFFSKIDSYDSLHDRYVKNRIFSLQNVARIDWNQLNELVGSKALINILKHVYVLNNLMDGFDTDKNFLQQLKIFIPTISK